MLSLLDPVELEDLVVFRDDEDPRKFHLLPDQPVIPTDDEGVPEFLFIKYIRDVATVGEGEEAGAGYVQFRSALTVDAARRQRVMDALRARLEAEKAAGKKPFDKPITITEPLLAAPLWTDGKVQLATFQVKDDGLVRKATESVPADLAGDLGASFALTLSDEGSEIFWDAFQKYGERQIPIVITYQLTYQARVSARLTIDAKRETIHRRTWTRARPHYFAKAQARWIELPHAGPLDKGKLAALRLQHVGKFIKPMIELPHFHEEVQQSITNNEVKVHIETGEGTGDNAAALQALLYKLATEVLTERVIPALFPSPDAEPGAASESDDKASRKLLSVDEDEGGDATFHLQLDHNTIVDRHVNPNGPVQLLIENPAALRACFKELRLSDGFFSLMKVSAGTLNVSFERDGIAGVHVWFKYEEVDEKHPDRPLVKREHDGLLRTDKDVLYFRFDTARDSRGAHKRAYRHRTETTYTANIPPTRTEWTTATDRLLTITPRVLGALRVELRMTARKEVVESARVELRHRSISGDLYEESFELTAEAPQKSWFQYTGDFSDAGDARKRYEWRARYRLPGGEVSTAWKETSDETLEVGSPFSKIAGFTLRPQGSFDGVQAIAGDVEYRDASRDYTVRRSFTLDKLTSAFQLDVPVLPGGPEKVTWSARVMRSDGSAVEIGPEEAGPGTVWVGIPVPRFLEVEIVSDLIDFDADVQLAIVELRYDDAENTISESHMVKLSKAQKSAPKWRVALRDPSKKSYRAHVRYIAYDRTKSAEVDVESTDDPLLVLERK